VDLHISNSDGVPVYLQVISQIKTLISSGRLQPGDELPPIRTLAKQLLINPNTVARAYRELEVEGWVVKRRGAGTYVADLVSPLGQEQKNKVITERILALLNEAHHMGVPLSALIEEIEKAAAEMKYEDK